ncbi:MAG TPA: non-ribosomal peptide synthetase, partial [Candidatus Angelobacter sp.]|nr:non-ribosomal peptide synthetase [Candidatus Angelobacter sp.]
MEKRGEQIALVQGERRVSYRELNGRANRLAHFLRSRGVAREGRVGIYMQRSIEQVSAILGVLKCGGAYVPLDPAYPEERLRYMIEAARLSTVLTTGASFRFDPPGRKITWIDATKISNSPGFDGNIGVDVHPQDAAYVIFTSGSTGMPNGVVGTHRGAINRFTWMWEQYPFAAGEVSALKTACNFVDSVWEIFGPLLQGIPSVILDDETVKDPPALVKALARARVTRLVLVPSLLRALLENEQQLAQYLPDIKYWTSSGEALSAELVRRFREQLPARTLLNLYGSSEASADSTAIDTAGVSLSINIPIGRPIYNTQAYLLDRSMQPVPIGIPGEIYLGGAGLAREYLFQPELTAIRFVPNPFATSPGTRLYRTGDIGRYAPDGTIQYVGRVDRQIKLRGIRIDLNEIEKVLGQHPALQHAVVMLVKNHPPIGDRLAAFVVSDQHPRPKEGELRRFLKERLPEYMVPGVYVRMEEMPLTANGKINRGALPVGEMAKRLEQERYGEWRSPVEELLGQIWEEVLGVDEVGGEDDFFARGGHSLLATQVIARIRKNLGV